VPGPILTSSRVCHSSILCLPAAHQPVTISCQDQHQTLLNAGAISSSVLLLLLLLLLCQCQQLPQQSLVNGSFNAASKWRGASSNAGCSNASS